MGTAPHNGFQCVTWACGTERKQGFGMPYWVMMQAVVQAKPQQFSLQSAIAASLKKSAAVQIANKVIVADAYRTGSLRSGYQPVITGLAQVTVFDQATRIRFVPGAPATQTIPGQMEAFTLSLAQRIDINGQIKLAVSQSKLQQIADQCALGGVQRARVLLTVETYLHVQRMRARIAAADLALKSAIAHRMLAQAAFDEGTGQRVDLLRAETAVVEAELLLSVMESGEATYRATLNNLIDVQLVSELELEPVSLGKISVSLDHLVRQAMDTRDDSLRADAVFRTAEFGVRIVSAGGRPSANLSALTADYPTFSFQTPRERVGQISLGITFPISDGKFVQNKVNEALQVATSARIERERTRNAVALDVTRGYIAWQQAERAADAALRARVFATEARDIARVRYQEHVGSYLDLLDAQVVQVRSDALVIDTAFDALIARATLLSAAGNQL